MIKDQKKHLANINNAADYLYQRIKKNPSVGIISGTGLECLIEILEEQNAFPVSRIPGFPLLGPSERIIISGRIYKHHVILLTKRLHVYEGFTMQQIASVVRIFKSLGVRILIITNAAGGLNPLFSPGGIMVITDHINLMGDSPLIGTNLDEFGPRFPDMTKPYDTELIQTFEASAQKLGIPLLKGVYVGVPGPNLETRAETRFLRMIGSDAVGMSTIAEVIAAVHCGIRVLGISVISNVNLPDNPKVHTLEDIVSNVKAASPALLKLIREFLLCLKSDDSR